MHAKVYSCAVVGLVGVLGEAETDVGRVTVRLARAISESNAPRGDGRCSALLGPA